MKAFIYLISFFLFLTGSLAHADDDLRASVAADYDENLEELYIHFHQNPELSNFEYKTARRLAAEIEVMG